jgi:D-aminopeptidase
MTIGYVTIGADDVEAAAPFYDAVLGAIGYERAPLDQSPPGWAFWAVKGGAPTVGLCRPYDGGAARGGNGAMLAFTARPEQIRAAHAAALASRGSTEPPAEGAVGAGTGMSCFGFKGGIGTASRRVGEHTVAVLLLTNFGVREELVVAGVPVGRLLPPADTGPEKPAGSCIGLVVTDAPVDGAACARLARRVGLGLARSGSVAHHGSGEIFLGFGTGVRLDRDGTPDRPALGGRALDPLFAAVVEAAEEAVLDSMFTAPTTVGRDGHTSESLHSPDVLALLRR